ncbi:MAG: DUF4139 domain-containing protein [Pseudomonadota bacterium]
MANKIRGGMAWLLAGMAIAVTDVSADTAITIYSKAQPGAVDAALYRPQTGSGNSAYTVPGYAIVRQQQTLELQQGRSEVRLTDVAALIDPTTVHFESLTDPDGTRVIEQDFRFDLVGTEKLFDRYIDSKIRVDQVVGDRLVTTNGVLLSRQGGLVVRKDDGSISVITDWQNVSLADLPGGLMTRPTLVWDIQAKRGGTHASRVSYETKGATWWADYNLQWQPGRDDNVGTLSVSAWVSILNHSGATYTDAKLKLIAGDVQRAQPEPTPMPRAMMMRSAEADVAEGFSEKELFEFHLYTLPRPTTIPNNATKQIELFPQVTGVPASKRLVYSAQGAGWGRRSFMPAGSDKVNAFIEFDNKQTQGLGMPLPAGRVRVSQADDADGSLEFIGEDVIEHTPRNESLRIWVGSAFDVLGERRVTDAKQDQARRQREETVEVTITNRKKASQPVTVLENLNGATNWELLETSDRYDKIDAGQIKFDITVPADSKKTVRYRVRYSW